MRAPAVREKILTETLAMSHWLVLRSKIQVSVFEVSPLRPPIKMTLSPETPHLWWEILPGLFGPLNWTCSHWTGKPLSSVALMTESRSNLHMLSIAPSLRSLPPWIYKLKRHISPYSIFLLSLIRLKIFVNKRGMIWSSLWQLSIKSDLYPLSFLNDDYYLSIV